jgi:SPP1 gp7 family putative phage head morphogenesis protein
MKFLPPLKLRDKYYLSIEAEIIRLFADVMFRPLLAAIKCQEQELINSFFDPLYESIVNGLVYWQDGHFCGEFNAKISKRLRDIGAIFNPKSKTWSIPRELIPVDLRFAQAGADSRYDNLRHAFLRTLTDMSISSIDKISDIPDEYVKTINWMEEDFQKSVKGITIPIQLTESQRNMIAAEWGQNLDKYVKDWTEQNILKLRQQVQANTFAGRRSVDLLKMLKDNYGVSQRKAKFLARQETSLLLSKFRETRYRDAGAKRYKWSTSHDERVRKDHDDLHNKIYSWDMPPVTNRRTGARNNPGEDFGCRCTAIALFE